MVRPTIIVWPYHRPKMCLCELPFDRVGASNWIWDHGAPWISDYKNIRMKRLDVYGSRFESVIMHGKLLAAYRHGQPGK